MVPTLHRIKLRVIAATSLAALMVLVCAGDSWSRDYRVRKKKKGYTVEISINRNPPVLGDNTIRISISDPQGKPFTGAQVLVNYYMPPMPGMPPMNYTTTAAPDRDSYEAVMDLIMAGPWNIIIKIMRDGRRWAVVFPIDVR